MLTNLLLIAFLVSMAICYMAIWLYGYRLYASNYLYMVFNYNGKAIHFKFRFTGASILNNLGFGQL